MYSKLVFRSSPASDSNSLQTERNALQAERDELQTERDILLESQRLWERDAQRAQKPVFSDFSDGIFSDLSFFLYDLSIFSYRINRTYYTGITLNFLL